MRKKSHISVARYIVSDLGNMEIGLVEHKKAFYLGNILPDCKPSFFTTKHEIEGTFDKFCEDLHTLFEKYDLLDFNARAFYRDLGQLIHYLADYFTFPHNKIYDGSLKDHCAYEKQLKLTMNEYLASGEVQLNVAAGMRVRSLEELTEYVLNVHKEYLEDTHTVEEDCRYIVSICHSFVVTVINLFFVEMDFRPAIA